jgi:type I restriction enzyme R subunit
MAIETQVQKGPLMNFIQDPIKGLGYEVKKASVIANNLVIKEDIIRILKLEDNINNYKSVLKNTYKNNEDLFHKEFIDFYHDKAYRSRNTAIFFSNNKTIIFKEHRFSIFFTSGSKISGDENFDKNIFSIVSELTYKVKEDSEINFNKRPDLCFFLNGILFSYCEFKYNNRGQTAREQGRGKVIKDYIDAVSDFAVPLEDKYSLVGEDIIKYKRESFLKLFEKVAHITAFDLNEMYAIRDIVEYQERIKTNTRNKSTDYSNIIKDIIKHSFHEVPHDNSKYKPDEKYKDFLKMFYSKKNIETEILYYNFLTYKRDENNKKKGTPKLISPRPKQKFGVDKVIDRTMVLYNNENNPNFIEEELYEKFGLMANNIKEERSKLKKNKDTNSLLLQYAAGFGKTMIMCWLALRLKDIELKNESLFNKILLVSDRIELRGQVESTMYDMNIEKTLFKEATDKDTFLEALNNKNTRIIIVNIQKFNKIQEDLSSNEKHNLASNRVAFIIDEIHRSQSGSQNQKMTNLFEDLLNSVESYSKGQNKKNMVIGLTATPSEDITARFGEIVSNDSSQGWGYAPFDAFTMKDAIEADFILNPTKKIFSCEPKIDIEDLENSQQKLPSKQEIYEDSKRISIISKQIAQILFKDTFKRIGGRGKGMLACTSIKAAIKYKGEIEIALEDEKINLGRKDDTNVFVVYSEGSQEHKKPKKLNKITLKNGTTKELSESEVIKEFKKRNKSIIIVVDKLQTGFDEPNLHTLFLDKEVSGINAVQTLCRINRKAKLKDDCLVIDFSRNSINKDNIKKAFDTYENLAVNDLKVDHIQDKLEEHYSGITTNPIYTKYIEEFREFLNPEPDMAFARKIGEEDEDQIKDLLFNNREMNKLSSGYMAIINLDDKYFNSELASFVKTIYNIVKSKNEKNTKTSVGFDVEDNLVMFELLLDQIKEIEESKKPKSNNKKKKLEDQDYIDKMNEKISALNDIENIKEDTYIDFKNSMDIIYKEMITNPKYSSKMRNIKQYEKYLTEAVIKDILDNVKYIKRRERKSNIYSDNFFKYFNSLEGMFAENIFLYLKGERQSIL